LPRLDCQAGFPEVWISAGQIEASLARQGDQIVIVRVPAYCRRIRQIRLHLAYSSSSSRMVPVSKRSGVD
jgi:hypothetical protein